MYGYVCAPITPRADTSADAAVQGGAGRSGAKTGAVLDLAADVDEVQTPARPELMKDGAVVAGGLVPGGGGGAPRALGHAAAPAPAGLTAVLSAAASLSMSREARLGG